ncbi:hypothetical protein ACFSNO_20840 [Streptomyces cirratus]
MPWALEAQRILAGGVEREGGRLVGDLLDELRREAVEVEEHNLLHPRRSSASRT